MMIIMTIFVIFAVFSVVILVFVTKRRAVIIVTCAFDKLVELSAVEPYASALGTIVNFNSVTFCYKKCCIVVGAFHASNYSGLGLKEPEFTDVAKKFRPACNAHFRRQLSR